MALAPSSVEMNIMRIGISCLLVFLATRVFAHVGDEIYPFLELLDEDLDRIDLTDGSVEDWYEVLGEPSLTATDFYWLNYHYDPSELDFRIWLAWHQGSNTVWIAMERFDDLYFNRYDGGGLSWMHRWDSSIAFLVDGDHTAGVYGEWIGAERDCETCTPERVLSHNRQAQRWMAIAEASDGEILDYDGFSEWVVREPYALAGSGVIGYSPATTVVEFMVTPFDDLIYDDEDASEVSQLHPGKTIGFTMTTSDNDATEYKDGFGPKIQLSLGAEVLNLRVNASLFVDGLLVGAGENPSSYDGGEDSAVEPSSWARIKAALK